MNKYIIKYGIIAGAVVVLISVISGWFLGQDPENFRMGEIIGYSTMVLSLLLIFLAVNEYKQKNPHTQLSFGQAFIIGIGISAIAGIIFGIYNWVYVSYLAPDFMDNYFNYYIENIKNSGEPQAQIEAQIAKLNEEKAFFMNPLVSFVAMFMSVFGIGLIISLVSAAAQRSKTDSTKD